MGIALGGRRVGTMAEVNVVPLIDILLVLLVIFMVIRPQAEFGIPVDLPERTDAQAPEPPGVIVVQVFGDGTLRINQDAVRWQDFQARLEKIMKPRASRTAFVRGDGILEFGIVVRAIDVMRASGITNVGLTTSELANAH